MNNSQFPILKRRISGRPLAYLDSASTTQKPQVVIEAVSNFYRRHNANVHRGIYVLSQEATRLYEEARNKVQRFIHAKLREEIVFTSGATEAINLVVWTWGHDHIKRGDEILLTEMEHHSNLVPWQMLAKKKGARLKFIPIMHNHNPLNLPYLKRERQITETSALKMRKGQKTETLPLKVRKGREGLLDLRSLQKLITSKTKIVALAHVSNVLGAINPVAQIIKIAHRNGALVLLDGAQAGGHIPVDVQKLDCDFYTLSGHKMYGPTGIGVLYGKKKFLKSMPPYQYGGHMIKSVGWETASWNDLPYKFEAGTANIAEAVGLKAAIQFLDSVGMNQILNHEKKLTAYALQRAAEIPGLKVFGPETPQNRLGVISFTVPNVPPHDLASILDQFGVAVRAGHHCAMPLHGKLGVEATARVSLGIYNTKKDIDKFIEAVKYAIVLFQNNS